MKILFWKKSTPLHIAVRAKGRVSKALLMFKKADESLQKANLQLSNALEKNNEEIESIKLVLENREELKTDIFQEIEDNEKLSQKLKDFLK